MRNDLYRRCLNPICGILHIVLVRVDSMLMTHINEGGNTHFSTCMKGVGELAVVLCLIVFATQFADAFEQSTPFFTKI